MIVKAWNNGAHHPDGNGYGIKISIQDRDKFFQRNWKTILVDLEGEKNPVEINIEKASFWNSTCRELISKEIGGWLISNHLETWPTGKLPSLVLVQKNERSFLLRIR